MFQHPRPHSPVATTLLGSLARFSRIVLERLLDRLNLVPGGTDLQCLRICQETAHVRWAVDQRLRRLRFFAPIQPTNRRAA